ncbi:uncharacterized protein [Periplaneta americana]|uniref:uncharacterized protein isoform X3 n=1 Tax=Periplaneta americana TaxID=6978 RepID=UPI0037E724C0
MADVVFFDAEDIIKRLLQGDIHGQYYDLLRLFEIVDEGDNRGDEFDRGFPPAYNYLFLGDYVDRGKNSLETICLLLAYKVLYPENFFLLRGNHETASINRVYGFYDECKRRYSVKLWKTFTDCFNCLPVAATIEDKIFCCHGGLSPDLAAMDNIKRIPRPTDVPDTGLLCDLLWSDPDKDTKCWGNSDRGVSFKFGQEIVTSFLKQHDFDLVCRAHQVVEDGYEFFAKRQLVTIFSAPNYCGEFDNAGAMMSVDEQLMCYFHVIKPIKKKIKYTYSAKVLMDSNDSINKITQLTKDEGKTQRTQNSGNVRQKLLEQKQLQQEKQQTQEKTERKQEKQKQKQEKTERKQDKRNEKQEKTEKKPEKQNDKQEKTERKQEKRNEKQVNAERKQGKQNEKQERKQDKRNEKQEKAERKQDNKSNANNKKQRQDDILRDAKERKISRIQEQTKQLSRLNNKQKQERIKEQPQRRENYSRKPEEMENNEIKRKNVLADQIQKNNKNQLMNGQKLSGIIDDEDDEKKQCIIS